MERPATAKSDVIEGLKTGAARLVGAGASSRVHVLRDEDCISSSRYYLFLMRCMLL
jgi:hypothetical protein